MKISTLPFLSSSLYVCLTPVISVYFELFSIPIPSYLFVSITSLLLLVAVIGMRGRLTYNSDFIGSIHYIYLIYSALVFFSFIDTNHLHATSVKFINIAYTLFVPVTIIILLHLFCSRRSEIDQVSVDKLFFKLFLISTVLMMFAFVFTRELDTEGRYNLPGMPSPIWVSRHFGAGMVAYFTYYMLNRDGLRFKPFLFSMVILGFLVSSGSKGPLLAAALTGLLLYINLNNARILILLKYALFISLFTVFLYFLTDSYIFNTEFFSIYHRVEALEFVSRSSILIWGNGLSSFGIKYEGEDLDIYPHNLFAETYFEFGIVGLMTTMAFILSIKNVFMHSIPGALTFYYFINAMVSGDIPGNAPLFIVALTAVFVSPAHNFNQKK
jgi:hypothetical protein